MLDTLFPGLPIAASYCSFTDGSNPKPLGVPLIAFFFGMSFVLGIVEVPMLCSCYDWCKVVARVTKPVAGLWIGRAVMHLLVGGGILAIGVHQNVRP